MLPCYPAGEVAILPCYPAIKYGVPGTMKQNGSQDACGNGDSNSCPGLSSRGTQTLW